MQPSIAMDAKPTSAKTEEAPGRFASAAAWTCVVLGFLLLAAHSLRGHGSGTALFWLAFLPLAFLRQAWVRRVLQGALFAGFLIWLDATTGLVSMRMAVGAPWLRLAAIMGAVALLTGGAVLCLEGATFRARFSRWPERALPALATFALAFAGLAAVQMNVPRPMLLAERFLPGAGWPELLLLSAYAAWILCRMLDRKAAGSVRRGIWSLFSLVFFGQLALGLLSRVGWAGFEVFLMTGKLHLPVPALILAGPLYRADGFFMLGLFLATLVLVGPAWCSHLCYIGAWDSACCASGRTKRGFGRLPDWTRPARYVLAGLVFASALVMGRLGVPGWTAFWLAAGFGLVGLTVMFLASRRLGVMVHCAAFCPMGALASLLGRLHPLRIGVGDGCSRCGACSRNCRYDALRLADLERGAPNRNCTLCGECVSVCPKSEIGYRFLGAPEIRLGSVGMEARTLFLVLVVSLHALFLGLARI